MTGKRFPFRRQSTARRSGGLLTVHTMPSRQQIRVKVLGQILRLEPLVNGRSLGRRVIDRQLVPAPHIALNLLPLLLFPLLVRLLALLLDSRLDPLLVSGLEWDLM